MKLFTKEVETKLQANYPKGSSFNQNVVAKIFDPTGSYTWYLMNQDPNDPEYIWAIVKGFEVETGSVGKSELEKTTGKLGLHLERDMYFKPMPAKELWDKLIKGEHV